MGFLNGVYEVIGKISVIVKRMAVGMRMLWGCKAVKGWIGEEINGRASGNDVGGGGSKGKMNKR